VSAALAATILVTSLLHSSGSGVWPGLVIVGNGTVPLDVALAAPSCGTTGCHRVFPGGLNLAVRCVPTARSLTPNQAISVTTSATGGQTITTWGGFVTQASAGTFTPGSNSQLALTTASVVTHTAAINSNNRVWTFGYKAPATPGLVELYTVVNTVNGSGTADAQDFWGFHGYNGAANVVTPVRLYVNAPGVTPIGASCVGSFGQFPVLGCKTPPAVPNASFALELHGAPPTVTCGLMLGANPSWQPLDLGIIGITGCSLYVDALLTIGATTGIGDLFRAEGTATFALPIPNDAGLHGGVLQCQVAILDANNGRPTTITMTNGLSVTIP
jgi:hypothetical protein